MRASSTRAELQQRGLIFQSHALYVGVAAQAFQVFVSEGLNGWFFGFTDPGYRKFHAEI